MKKIVTLISLAVITACFAITVFAGTFSHVHSLRNGTTAFTVKVLHPKKIILYPESRGVKTSYSAVCIKGILVSHFSRTFDTSYTRNLLYKLPIQQDVCYITVAAATKNNTGQIVVQVTN